MQLAFIVFKYFPFGGLQKDMLGIAEQCVARAHQVSIYCREWQGGKPKGIEVIEIPVKSGANHVRDRVFAEHALQACKGADMVVGFNKMPGLDVYYAADSCYMAKVFEERSVLSRLSPRYRHYRDYEQAVFAGDTDILMISEKEIPAFQRYHQTPDERFHLLPPGISRDRIIPLDYELQRKSFRQQWDISETEKLLLFVGSGFKTKGLDRAIRALASLGKDSSSRLFVIGQDNARPFVSLARRLGVDSQLRFLEGRDDVPAFLWGADVLIHPAYRENTGTVLLEAMVAGLPVLTTDACGYAHYVRENNLGAVVASPFQQQVLNAELQRLLAAADNWQDRAREFAKEADIFDMNLRAAEKIEQIGMKRHA